MRSRFWVMTAAWWYFALGSAFSSSFAQEKPLSSISISEEAKRIHAAGYVFDGHNDLPWAVRNKAPKLFEEIDIRQSQPQLHTDIERLKRGNVGAQFWSVYVPVDTIETGSAFQKTVDQIDLVKDMVRRYPDVFELAYSADDVERIRKSGKIASLMGMEGGHSIENSIGKLKQLYLMGARYMTLTHTATLDWADAATDESKNSGLSSFGEEVVREMNRLGMLVDLSHVSPETMHDALRISTAPIIFSHSSSKAIANHPRNVPDDVLVELKKNGGVVMVNFFPGFVHPEAAAILSHVYEIRKELKAKYGSDKEGYESELKRWQLAHPYPAGDATTVVDHIHQIIQIAGIDHVGLGSDFDGIAKVPVGLEDVSTYPVITELLLQKGYSENEIHKVMYGNILRVLREAQQEARKAPN